MRVGTIVPPLVGSIRRAAFFCRSAMEPGGGVAMVQGASRGIGLEFVRQLLEKKEKGQVIATCRDPSRASFLQELKGKYTERLDILPLDVTDESSIKASTKSINERYGSLNLLINASGVLSIPGVLQPETTLNKVEKSSLMFAYEVNAAGPTLVIKVFFSNSFSVRLSSHVALLKLGGQTASERKFSIVANLSARVSSIGDNGLGGWHSYRSSKTALNQLTKNISLEFARRKDPIVCILLHPGTVDTDLSKPFQRGVPEGKLFTPEFSVGKLLAVIEGTEASDNGKFFAWDGQQIPW
ncbi:unnamed protein product [Spirodela intermedia]|uniref:Uncharacterized protein n=1 Tax=Spirodela intermedia TaxID=51605 RepID=A0A7I8IJB5_SPIIN|nr:unnamed protein product [Spirodela intermedia]CAA6657977.1 unnamed protein product [Spirodela intermedia]